MCVFKLTYARLYVWDLAHHGYIVSVTNVIKAVCSILYWNTKCFSAISNVFTRWQSIEILTSLITVTFNTAGSCLRIILPKHLSVLVERSTGKISWNRAHVQKNEKKEIICGRDKSNNTVDTISSVLVEKARRGRKANKGTKGHMARAWYWRL